jgi:hypothetical protein
MIGARNAHQAGVSGMLITRFGTRLVAAWLDWPGDAAAGRRLPVARPVRLRAALGNREQRGGLVDPAGRQGIARHDCGQERGVGGGGLQTAAERPAARSRCGGGWQLPIRPGLHHGMFPVPRGGGTLGTPGGGGCGQVQRRPHGREGRAGRGRTPDVRTGCTEVGAPARCALRRPGGQPLRGGGERSSLSGMTTAFPDPGVNPRVGRRPCAFHGESRPYGLLNSSCL